MRLADYPGKLQFEGKHMMVFLRFHSASYSLYLDLEKLIIQKHHWVESGGKDSTKDPSLSSQRIKAETASRKKELALHSLQTRSLWLSIPPTVTRWRLSPPLCWIDSRGNEVGKSELGQQKDN